MELYTASGKKITIEDNPIGRGGEGEIHKVTSSLHRNHCVKLYFDKYRTIERQRKIEFMITHPPSDLAGENYVVCWPVEVVFQKTGLFSQKQFVGFIMPFAFPDSKDLYELCLPKSNKLPPIWQQKYDRTIGAGLLARMKLCTNLASSIHRVHSLNKYVFVDMKPQNILVTDDSKISLIDLDSIQISENSQLLFPALVSTGEYEPPEAKTTRSNGNAALEESWDRFSMAVIFYEILFAIHPYVASFSGKYKSCTTISEYIQNNLFVHGSNKKYINVLPQSHKNYRKIPPTLQNLFSNAFQSNPLQRCSAEEFGKTFYNIVTDVEPVSRQTVFSVAFTNSLPLPPNPSIPTFSIPKKTVPSNSVSTKYIIGIFLFLIVTGASAFFIYQEYEQFFAELIDKEIEYATKEQSVLVEKYIKAIQKTQDGVNQAQIDAQKAIQKEQDDEKERKRIAALSKAGRLTEYANELLKNPNDTALFKQRIESLPKINHINRKEARKLNDKGLNHLARHEYTEAVNSFSDAYNTDPADIEIIGNLGVSHYKNGNLDDAEKNTLLSLRLKPDRIATWKALGAIYARKNEVEKAENCFIVAYNFSTEKNVLLGNFLNPKKFEEVDKPEVRKAVLGAIEKIKRSNNN